VTDVALSGAVHVLNNEQRWLTHGALGAVHVLTREQR
jgi:hypothetical protein